MASQDKITSFDFISVPDLYSKGETPDFEKIRQSNKNYDFTIVYPHYATDEERKALRNIALGLSKNNKVLLYEASIEAGGGAETPIIVDFVYQHFQPLIEIGKNIVFSVALSYVYDLMKELYKSKNNSITKSQFSLVREYNGIEYHYIFDNLNADQALKAVKLIPKDMDEKVDSETYTSKYQTYLPAQNKWVEVQI